MKKKAAAPKAVRKPLYTPGCTSRLGSSAAPYPGRSEFRRDYGRLVHSPVFRRLQGKTQLFPGHESDFFRNRLTHSYEVAQVAKGIALGLNQDPFFRTRPLDTDLIELAGLAHDLGHPPFGHNGEEALDDCMKAFGGFEGNAQTLRILTHLEKKVVASEDAPDTAHDNRLGLDLCMRSLAAVLKYDKPIPLKRSEKADLVKGFYQEEADVVKRIKRSILGTVPAKFKTVECHIMDVADDIAYSTYDVEDSFKAGFLSPIDMLASSGPIINRVAESINKADELPFKVKPLDVVSVLYEVFSGSLAVSTGAIKGELQSIFSAAQIYRASSQIAENGHYRTAFTSSLVNQFIEGVTLVPNAAFPMLSVVKLDDDTRLKVEVLKRYTYHAITMSPRLRLVEYRGYDIVTSIFRALAKDKGHYLLPDDLRERFMELRYEQPRSRLICDYVAGMTDRYAVEFFARIESVNPQTIFKPH